MWKENWVREWARVRRRSNISRVDSDNELSHNTSVDDSKEKKHNSDANQNDDGT